MSVGEEGGQIVKKAVWVRGGSKTGSQGHQAEPETDPDMSTFFQIIERVVVEQGIGIDRHSRKVRLARSGFCRLGMALNKIRAIGSVEYKNV